MCTSPAGGALVTGSGATALSTLLVAASGIGALAEGESTGAGRRRAAAGDRDDPALALIVGLLTGFSATVGAAAVEGWDAGTLALAAAESARTGAGVGAAGAPVLATPAPPGSPGPLTVALETIALEADGCASVATGCRGRRVTIAIAPTSTTAVIAAAMIVPRDAATVAGGAEGGAAGGASAASAGAAPPVGEPVDRAPLALDAARPMLSGIGLYGVRGIPTMASCEPVRASSIS